MGGRFIECYTERADKRGVCRELPQRAPGRPPRSLSLSLSGGICIMLVLLSISSGISSSWLGYTRPSSKAKLLLHFASLLPLPPQSLLKAAAAARGPACGGGGRKRAKNPPQNPGEIMIKIKETRPKGSGVRAERAFYPAFSPGCSPQLCPAGTCLPLGACGIAVVAARRPDLPHGMALSQISGPAIASGSWGKHATCMVMLPGTPLG